MANKIFRIERIPLRVDLQTESADGLVLCPSDPNDCNFMIDDEGNLWVIDFGRTCFLPPSFMSFSLTTSFNAFVRIIARRLNYPPSPNLKAMSVASGRLVTCGNNAYGK